MELSKQTVADGFAHRGICNTTHAASSTTPSRLQQWRIRLTNEAVWECPRRINWTAVFTMQCMMGDPVMAAHNNSHGCEMQVAYY